MLDRAVRRVIDPCLEPVAAILQRVGLTANAVTVLGFLLGLLGCVAIAAGWLWLGLVLVLGNRLADGLDGILARRVRRQCAGSGGIVGGVTAEAVGGTDLGGFLDIVLDLLFYAAVPLSFGLLDRERNLLPAAVLLVSFFGTSGSFLAYATLKARGGLQSRAAGVAESLGGKSFFYSVGLMEGSETVLFFLAFCVFPDWFAELAWLFALLCGLTTVQRVAAGVREFGAGSGK